MHDFNEETEYNILNVLLTAPEKHAYIFENVRSEYFTNALNQKVFEAARELYEKGEEINTITLFEKTKSIPINERVVDILTYFTPLKASIRYHVQAMYKHFFSKLIESAKTREDYEKIKQYEDNHNPCSDLIQHISTGADRWQERYDNSAKTMLTTGYRAIDENVGSFQGGDYITLGGSTGMGKTTIALNIAKMLCCQGKKVLYCSLEMPLEQLQNRFVCMIVGLSSLKFRSCGFNFVELTRYKEGLKSLKDWSLYIITDYALTPDKLETYIQNNRPDFVIVDYLGLMSGYVNKSLYEKSTILSRKIKLVATRLNIPIMVLVQLNRDLKSRQDKRPILSDIRESGAIEQDADFVFFAHREGIYNPDVPESELEFIIAKNRHGKANVTEKLNFNLITQEITN